MVNLKLAPYLLVATVASISFAQAVPSGHGDLGELLRRGNNPSTTPKHREAGELVRRGYDPSATEHLFRRQPQPLGSIPYTPAKKCSRMQTVNGERKRVHGLECSKKFQRKRYKKHLKAVSQGDGPHAELARKRLEKLKAKKLKRKARKAETVHDPAHSDPVHDHGSHPTHDNSWDHHSDPVHDYGSHPTHDNSWNQHSQPIPAY